jgi:hypothetical protein
MRSSPIFFGILGDPTRPAAYQKLGDRRKRKQAPLLTKNRRSSEALVTKKICNRQSAD